MIKIYKYSEVDREKIFARENTGENVSGAVAEIIGNVRKNGDSALFEYCKKFDGAELSALEVTAEELDEAVAQVDSEFIGVIERAAENIRAYHRHQVRSGFIISENEGIVLSQRVRPLDRAGLYIPGGTASYPSSVLMNCIPAKIAGVGELVLTTPPKKDGKINPHILAAAKIAGADRIFKVGGAQAIAALAYGTESIPRVDKIVGPGNAYVAEAKRQVFGKVAIDMIAGPSEILIVADGTCDPVVVAADMLSQAEHDKMASAVLVTTSEELAGAVAQELERQLKLLPREEIARASIENNGKIIIAQSIEQAISVSNELAPEHLELCVEDPFAYMSQVRHAGSVFMGKNCPEALGDYFAGPNHTLPTGGTARFSSPLSVDDFIVKSSFTYYTADALRKVSKDVEYFAEKEGLSAHARSAVVRFRGEEK